MLLTVDDLQDGGAATVDLLGYLAGRLGDARVLVVAAVRAEDADVAARLADRAAVVRLGALPRSAVDALAAAAGLTAHGEQVMARTAGHPLSVVEYLRALAQGDAGVPESLADAVLDPRRAARRRRPHGRRGGRGAAPPHRPGPAGRAGGVVRRGDDARLRGAGPAPSARAQRASLRVRQRPAAGVRARCLAPGAVAGLPPPRRRPDLRPARDDGRARAPRRRRAARGPGVAAGRRGGPAPGRGGGRPRPARPVARRRDVVRGHACAGAAGPRSGPRGPHRLRLRPRRRQRGPGAGPVDPRAATGDGGPALPGRRRRSRTRAHRRRAGRTRWKKGCGWPPTSATAARRPTSAAGWPSSRPAGSA